MTANQLRKKYLEFFASKGHVIIPSASLVPRETDASTLFTTAGMHPLVPYLLGEVHPGGKRVANVQKCVRTGDIEDVGDNRHLTFFEMLGNWSFGDYFKKEAIEWSWEFLTDEKWLGLDKNRIYVTVFKGEENIPRDQEAIEIWLNVFKKAGIEAKIATEDEKISKDVKIIPLGKDDNFWIAGMTGPCGGDTEMFYDTRPEDGKIEGKFGKLVDNFRLIEIWNNVFMEFNKTNEGKYEKLSKPNVDTGMGVERTLAVISGKETVFETELFSEIFERISEISEKKYIDFQKEFRIIADHIRASSFMLADGVVPENTGKGYILRRLIRRAVRHGKTLGIEKEFISKISEVVIEKFGDFYPELEEKKEIIISELKKESDKFSLTLEKGLREFDRVMQTFLKSDCDEEYFQSCGVESKFEKELMGKVVFNLYATFGFPVELIREIAKEKNIGIDEGGFEKEFLKHQELSRTASSGMFKGGLQDSGEESAKLHTATHLLLAALRQVLGNNVFQKGSNITPERLRLDFSHTEKMTKQQIEEVEKIVNAAIASKLDVVREEMTLEEAKKQEAMGVFESKYGNNVSVYSIVDDKHRVVSREICGGPHTKNTGNMGLFRIQKEEASSAGVRRIKAVLE